MGRRPGLEDLVAYLALATLTGVVAHLVTQTTRQAPPPTHWLHYAPERHGVFDMGPTLAPPPVASPGRTSTAAAPPVLTVASDTPAALATGPEVLVPSSAGRAPLPERTRRHVRAQVVLESVRFVPRVAARRPGAGVGSGGDVQADRPSPLVATADQAVSTFSPDPERGGWRAVREALAVGRLPAPDRVRAEDLVNAQASDVPLPPPGQAVTVDVEAAPHPWRADRHLLRVGLRAAAAPALSAEDAAHLVLVVDTSGSMTLDGRLDHVKATLHGLVDSLGPDDRMTLVAYADAGEILAAELGPDHTPALRTAIDSLRPDGASAMAAGLETAWTAATRAWTPGVDQRVVVFTDGEAHHDLASLGTAERDAARWAGHGLRLDVVGVGLDGQLDPRAAKLAESGGGRSWSLAGFPDARALPSRLRGRQAQGPAEIEVAVAFASASVAGWRLVGHEGAPQATPPPVQLEPGQGLTALYEVAILPGALAGDLDAILGEVQLGLRSHGQTRRWTVPMTARAVRSRFDAVTRDLRVSLAAASFAGLLRSQNRDLDAYARVANLAEPPDHNAHDQDRELARLVRQAGRLSARGDRAPSPDGGLAEADQDLLARRLMRAQDSLAPCARAHGRDGTLQLALTLQDGRVASAQAHHDGGDGELEACAAQAAALWRFPSGWDAAVEVPVVLAHR